MAFPGNSVTSLAAKWQQIKDTSGRIKNECVFLNAAAAVTRKRALDFGNFLADALALLNTLTANATTNGLLEYARSQENNPTLDLTTEYTTMRTQLVATQDWLVANFPNTTGELRVYTFDANKRYADINLTAGQLSSFKTQINALAATIA